VTLAERFATPEPTICTVCRRHATGLAYATGNRGPWLWLCTNSDCHSLAREVCRMPEEKIDAFERAAAEKAWDDFAAWLDSLGKTDLKQLTDAEWQEAPMRFFLGCTTELRRKLLSNEPPF
jgi:hypothetical protein